MIRCRDGSLYTGITTDVDRRFAEHQKEGGPGAKYLRGRKPLELVYKRKLGAQGLALRVESRVKKLPKEKKEQVVNQKRTMIEIIRKAKQALNERNARSLTPWIF
jgi:putative endonuclease